MRGGDGRSGAVIHCDVAVAPVVGVDAVTGIGCDVGAVGDQHGAVDAGIGSWHGRCANAAITGIDAAGDRSIVVVGDAGMNRAVGGDGDRAVGRRCNRRVDVDDVKPGATGNDLASRIRRDGFAARTGTYNQDAVLPDRCHLAGGLHGNVAVALRPRLDPVRAAAGTAQCRDGDIALVGGVEIFGKDSDRSRTRAGHAAGSMHNDVAASGRAILGDDAVAGETRDIA